MSKSNIGPTWEIYIGPTWDFPPIAEFWKHTCQGGLEWKTEAYNTGKCGNNPRRLERSVQERPTSQANARPTSLHCIGMNKVSV